MAINKTTSIAYLFLFGGFALGFSPFLFDLSDSVTSVLTSIGLLSVLIGFIIKTIDVYKYLQRKRSE